MKTSWKLLEDVLKTYGQDEYIHLDQDALKTSSEDVRLRRTIYLYEDVLITSSEDEDKRSLQDVFKASSSRRMFSGYSFTISKMESKIDFVFQSVYAMLIPNRFSHLFNIFCKDFCLFVCLFVFYDKEGCRNKVLSSYSMSHYHKRRYQVC